ncbi:MAG: hypothetical protein FJ098_06125 [Deltaproteobacteria bacterium]|nr:hypothetical protein [Deltaproteobacteria bacterium]
MANADRGLPFRDGVVAAAFSLDARRPAAELARVLAPQGVLVAAVPAAEDLLELRELVLGRGILLPGGDAVVRELASVFVPLARERVEERVTLDLPGLTALADSTYRLSRRREREALLAGGPREVVSRHDLLLFVRARPQP